MGPDEQPVTEGDDPPHTEHEVFVDDNAGLSDSHVVHGYGEGGEVILTGGEGQDRDARTASGGEITEQYGGGKPSREESELRASALLVAYLNQQGAKWGAPKLTNASARDERAVDCTAEGPQGELRLQVTTPERAAQVALDRASSFDRTTTRESMVEAVRAAIEEKRNSSDRRIRLVVDAVHFPGHAFRSVAEEFQQQLGPWARQVGWQEVWLVGPSVDLVYRLDTNSDA